MQSKGLLFIPDISGFSRFVAETEIDHSRLIIQELLELLINSNDVGLEVSEVEGDAILFYKFGDAPSLQELYKQVEKMFCAFHRHLAIYEVRKYCQCKACTTAIQLSLKVISHYGEFTDYTVKNFTKLIGKDVIVAHQLLKNDIEKHEYWLVTEDLLPKPNAAGFPNWMHWDSGSKETESGAVEFQYAQLSPLKKQLPPELPQDFGLASKTKMFSVSDEFDADLVTLFHATGDFEYRHRWMEGIKAVEEFDHLLPRVGMRCRFSSDSGPIEIIASSYFFDPGKIQFSETEMQKGYAYHYTLDKMEPGKTRLTIDFYIRNNLLERLYFSISKKNSIRTSLKRSLQNLHAAAKDVIVPPSEVLDLINN